MFKSNILYLYIIFYLVAGLLGLEIGWAVFQYDELRLLQFPLAVIAFISLLVSRSLAFSILTQCSLLLIGPFILGCFASYNIFQLQELFSAITLVLILAAFTVTLKENVYKYNGIFLVVIAASIPCLFIFISIFNLINEKQWFDWQFNSGSIRIYDSVIVPLFFFLILLKNKNYPYSQYFYPTIVFLFSLAWLFDGARSALLSVFVGLAILFVFSKIERRLVILTLLYMLFAFLLYKWTYSFVDRTPTVLRAGTSLRAEMWFYMFEQWKLDPIWGVGGGHLSKIQYPYGHHIHNLYLRLIFEWGGIGLLFLLWIFYQIFLLLKDQSVHMILKAGIVAILVDAMFSGNMVYPLSQIACILFVAFSFSQRSIIQYQEISSYKILSTKILIIFFGILFLYLSYSFFLQDLTCWGCASNIGRMAPNFWFHGGAEHLVPYDQIK